MKSTTMTAAEKYQPKRKSIKDYEQSIVRALELQDLIGPLKEELESIKQEFLELLGNGKTIGNLTTASGSATLKIANNYSIDPKMLPDLKKIFGKMLPSFVKEKVTYGVEPSLKKLLADADYEHADTIRDAVIIKQSPSVVFEPVTKLAEAFIKGEKKKGGK